MQRRKTILLVVVFFLIPLMACNLSTAANPTPSNGGSVPTAGDPSQNGDQQPSPGPGSAAPPHGTQPLETAAPIPSATELPPTATPCTSDSEFITDINIPDGTLISPGETFTKAWRIRNDGTCIWTTDFTWEQINASGHDLVATTLSMPLPHDVAPGEQLDISVELTLDPGATLGSRQVARFQMRSPSEGLFGTRPFASIFAVNGSGICPPGNADLDPYIHLTDRYCFLYPDTHTVNQGATGAVSVSAPPPGGPGEQIVPNVSISNDGSVGGLTIQQWSNQKISAAQAPGNPPTTTNTTVGGEPAVAAEGLPGIMGTRIVYVIHDNTGFVITIFPVDGSASDETDQALDLWEIMRVSFAFYGP